ncbi:MAG: clan AA aspartic protease [Bacteroidia bacterium]
MELVYANIELVNSGDEEMLSRGLLQKDNIRRTNVSALVDSGAYVLCINDRVRTQLGLRTIDTQSAQLANGEITEVDIVGPVEVKFLNRSTSCRAMVLPGDNEVLLGSIPMEDMDVIIDPREQKLTLPPDRPYVAQKSLK